MVIGACLEKSARNSISYSAFSLIPCSWDLPNFLLAQPLIPCQQLGSRQLSGILVKTTGTWNQIIFVGILLIEMAMINEVVLPMSGQATRTAGPPVQQQTTPTPPSYRSIPEPQKSTSATRTVTVTVGTEWYDPNTEKVPLHIFGQPKIGGVAWQGRLNYDDSTIQSMPPIDNPKPTFFEITGSVRAIEYRVTPGQSVTSCPFIFRFDPPQ
jgi:hypothetical protein